MRTRRTFQTPSSRLRRRLILDALVYTIAAEAVALAWLIDAMI